MLVLLLDLLGRPAAGSAPVFDSAGAFKNGKNITDIKYKEIRKILKLSDDFKIFNKEDSYKSKDKTQENTIIKFHFIIVPTSSSSSDFYLLDE